MHLKPPLLSTPNRLRTPQWGCTHITHTSLVMRLLDARTLELQWFNDDSVPKYAILSHTWGGDEVTYQELVWINRAKAFSASQMNSSTGSFSSSQDDQAVMMLGAIEMMIRGNSTSAFGSINNEEDVLQRKGYSKIVHAAEEALSLGCEYVWVDTCCIDKSSSSELQESINSMFKWYVNAEVCIVYLEDVEKPSREVYHFTASEMAKSAFSTCRWTKRGWTLQELVAPDVCRFYFKDWTLMGEKQEFLNEIAEATGIAAFVLEDRTTINEVPVAERMSWASYRQSTRLEDVAYSLLGIFDIQMPLLYGEGDKAFIRLQEEILKTTDDYSLFAWTALEADASTYRGLLARSPFEFRDCHALERDTALLTYPISFTPVGLQVQLEFLPTAQPVRSRSRRQPLPQHPSIPEPQLALIRTSNSLNQRLAISLTPLDAQAKQYARVSSGSLVAIDDWPSGTPKVIYVRQTVTIPPDLVSPDFRCFAIRKRLTRRHTGGKVTPVRIISAWPREAWAEASSEMTITPRGASETAGKNDVIAMLLLHVQAPGYAGALDFPVAFGFRRSTCHYWVKAMSMLDTEGDAAAMNAWVERTRRRLPAEVWDVGQGKDVRSDIVVVGSSGVGINIGIKAGLVRDSVALVVELDGLVLWQ